MRYLEEQQARANELLSKPEVCLPWEPIPVRFSGAWQVDVTHVAEEYGEDRPPGKYLTIALTTYNEPTVPTPSEEGAWRIDFARCQAYRKRIIHYVGAAPLTRPDAVSAFWEITGSHYLVESGVWAAHPSLALHHWVIVSGIHRDPYGARSTCWRLAVHAAITRVGAGLSRSAAYVAAC